MIKCISDQRLLDKGFIIINPIVKYHNRKYNNISMRQNWKTKPKCINSNFFCLVSDALMWFACLKLV